LIIWFCIWYCCCICCCLTSSGGYGWFTGDLGDAALNCEFAIFGEEGGGKGGDWNISLLVVNDDAVVVTDDCNWLLLWWLWDDDDNYDDYDVIVV